MDKSSLQSRWPKIKDNLCRLQSTFERQHGRRYNRDTQEPRSSCKQQEVPQIDIHSQASFATWGRLVEG